jgi:hypothetical protein
MSKNNKKDNFVVIFKKHKGGASEVARLSSLRTAQSLVSFYKGNSTGYAYIGILNSLLVRGVRP